MSQSQELRRITESLERLNHLDVEVPTTHYHYTRAESAIRILESGGLILSTYEKLNDPYDLDTSIIDFSCDLDTFLDYIENLHPELIAEKGSSHYRDTFIADDTERISKQQSLFQKYRSNLGIGCMSAGYENTLMWSHYGDRHMGIVIGFSYKAFMPECFVYPVKYVDKKPLVKFFDHRISPLTYLAFLKSDIWAYEKEIRLAHYQINQFERNLIPFDRSMVERIYFGLKTSPKHKADVIKVLKEGNYPDTVEIFEMMPNPDNYGFLEPRKIIIGV